MGEGTYSPRGGDPRVVGDTTPKNLDRLPASALKFEDNAVDKPLQTAEHSGFERSAARRGHRFSGGGPMAFIFPMAKDLTTEHRKKERLGSHWLEQFA